MRRATACLMIPALAALLALGGCENFDPESWFSTKKPLPGERKPVFPGGVPGVPQGVPPELLKGYQPPVEPPPPPAPARANPRQRATPSRPAPQAAPGQQRWPEPPPGAAQQSQQSQQQQQARWPEPPPGAPSR